MEIDDDDGTDDTAGEDSVREELKEKQRELEMNLAIVKRALALLEGDVRAEEIFRAVQEALDI